MASGFLGHLMNNARESEQRRKERQAQMEQQRLEMMKQGYDVSDTPQLTPGQQMASALQRGLNYDAQRDDPTPTYIRNQYNADVIARDRADQEMEESKERILTEQASRKIIEQQGQLNAVELDLRQKQLGKFEELHQLEVNEINARIGQSTSATALNDLKREVSEEEFRIFKELEGHRKEVRDLEKSQLEAQILSAHHKTLEDSKGNMWVMNLKDQTMTQMVDGSKTQDEQDLAEAITYIRILSEIDSSDSDLKDMPLYKTLQEKVNLLLDGDTFIDALETRRKGGVKSKKDLGPVGKTISMVTGREVPSSFEDANEAPSPAPTSAPDAPDAPEETTPMGEQSVGELMGRVPSSAMLKMGSVSPASFLFNNLSLYQPTTEEENLRRRYESLRRVNRGTSPLRMSLYDTLYKTGPTNNQSRQQ